MNIYKALRSTRVDDFCTSLRRMGYTAYVEQNGSDTLLITDYNVTGDGFQYIGQR